MKIATILGTACAILSAAAPSWAQQGYPGGAWGPHMMGSWFGGGYLGMIFNIIIWVALIAGVIAAVRWLFSQGRDGSQQPPATGDRSLQILRERFARGDITKEEFQAMRRELEV